MGSLCFVEGLLHWNGSSYKRRILAFPAGWQHHVAREGMVVVFRLAVICESVIVVKVAVAEERRLTHSFCKLASSG